MMHENCVVSEKINSDFQFAYGEKGNCLDDTVDFIDLYFEKAKEMVRVEDLMNISDVIIQR